MRCSKAACAHEAALEGQRDRTAGLEGPSSTFVGARGGVRLCGDVDSAGATEATTTLSASCVRINDVHRGGSYQGWNYVAPSGHGGYYGGHVGEGCRDRS
jgi:hypothetical protein